MSDLWNQVKMQFKDFPAEIRDRIQAEQQEVIEEAVLSERICSIEKRHWLCSKPVSQEIRLSHYNKSIGIYGEARQINSSKKPRIPAPALENNSLTSGESFTTRNCH